MEIEQQHSSTRTVLSQSAKDILYATARWGKFLSILGFIGLGLMLLGGLFSFAISPTMPTKTGMIAGPILGLIYLLMATIYFFPLFYLFRFSTDVKQSIYKPETNIDDAFDYLKKHYKFIGILTIIVLSIYVLFIGFTLLSASLL